MVVWMHENIIRCGFCGKLMNGLAKAEYLLHHRFSLELTIDRTMSFTRAYFFYFYFSYSSPTAVKSGKRS
jgi:hypothetical protein